LRDCGDIRNGLGHNDRIIGAIGAYGIADTSSIAGSEGSGLIMTRHAGTEEYGLGDFGF
jgi:hypothetical protein